MTARGGRLPALARRPWLRRLLLAAVFLTFDLILFGTFVRLSDAGLGCPDWPGCYGHASPIGASEQIRIEAESRPQGPVTVFKAWVEMLHRYIAAALGLLIIVVALLARRARLRSALAYFTVVWVIVQGLFGMWTVTLRLQPAVVTAHLLGGVILFALLVVQLNRIVAHPAVAREAANRGAWPWRIGIRIGLALVFMQIALGGWVSSNYATLACGDFPKCQGSWWPDMAFAAGFEWWRPLGLRADGSALPFAALTAIHYAHRLTAYVVLVVIAVLAWRLRRTEGLRGIALVLLAILGLQLFTGLTTIFLEWPMLAAVLHTGGATALVGSLLMLDFRVGRARMAA